MSKLFTFLLVVVSYTATNNLLQAQTLSLGAKVTPLVLAAPKIINPSDAFIDAGSRFSYNFGIYLNYYTKKPWGLRAGLEFGSIPFEKTVSAPVNAFGSGNGSGLFYLHSTEYPYKYHSFTPSILYKIPIKKSYLELVGGPSFRYYYHGKDSNGFVLRHYAKFST